MYFEKLIRKRDTLIQSIRMSESQPEIFNEVSNSRVYVTYILKQTIMNGWPSIHNRAPKQLYNVWEKLMG